MRHALSRIRSLPPPTIALTFWALLLLVVAGELLVAYTVAPHHLLFAFLGALASTAILIAIAVLGVRRRMAPEMLLTYAVVVLVALIFLLLANTALSVYRQADSHRAIPEMIWLATAALAISACGLLALWIPRTKRVLVGGLRLGLVVVPIYAGFLALERSNEISSPPPALDLLAQDSDADLFIRGSEAPAAIGLTSVYNYAFSDGTASGDVSHQITVPDDTRPFDWLLVLTGPAVIGRFDQLPAGARVVFSGPIYIRGFGSTRVLQEQVIAGRFGGLGTAGVLTIYGEPAACNEVARQVGETGIEPSQASSPSFAVSGATEMSKSFPVRSHWWLNGQFPSVGLPPDTKPTDLGGGFADAGNWSAYKSPSLGYGCTQINVGEDYTLYSSLPTGALGYGETPLRVGAREWVTFAAPNFVTRPGVIYRRNGWESAATRASFIAGGLLGIGGAALLGLLDGLLGGRWFRGDSRKRT